MSKLQEKAEKYLKDHPGTEVHGVANDPNRFLFLRSYDAKAHAITLGGTEIESFGTPTSHIEVNDAQTISGNQLNEQELAEKNAEAEKKAEAAEKAKADAEKKATAEAEAKAKADAKAAEKAKADADAKAAEKAKADADAKAAEKAKADADAKAADAPKAPKVTKKTTTKK